MSYNQILRSDKMVNTSVLFFSNIIPIIMAISSLFVMVTGVMEKQNVVTLIGAILFLLAGLLPFIILPVLGV